MNKDYIVINGTRYRVEANWNAILSYLKQTGRNTIEGLSCFSALAPSDLAELMAVCINEGERLEGKQTQMTAEWVGENCGMSEISAFMVVFSKQVTPDLPKQKKA